jgi:hypothetical protein
MVQKQAYIIVKNITFCPFWPVCYFVYYYKYVPKVCSIYYKNLFIYESEIQLFASFGLFVISFVNSGTYQEYVVCTAKISMYFNQKYYSLRILACLLFRSIFPVNNCSRKSTLSTKLTAIQLRLCRQLIRLKYTSDQI